MPELTSYRGTMAASLRHQWRDTICGGGAYGCILGYGDSIAFTYAYLIYMFCLYLFTELFSSAAFLFLAVEKNEYKRSRPLGNEDIETDLGTTNSCVEVIKDMIEVDYLGEQPPKQLIDESEKMIAYSERNLAADMVLSKLHGIHLLLRGNAHAGTKNVQRRRT
ncbi:hypothetical protein Tco_1437768 [Tanacetum coccineum]